MPNLSQYIDYSIQLDLLNRVVVLDDISLYPEGVQDELVGVVSVTQPDGFTIEGNWDSPGVRYENGQLTNASVLLRMEADGLPQCGTYTIKYKLDHPGYTPSEHTKTFEFNYTRPTGVITDRFDVFSPKLEVKDDTAYAVPGMANTSLERLWNAVHAVGTASGTDDVLDLSIPDNYHDGYYNVELRSDVSYAHGSYTFLTVKDRIVTTKRLLAKRPPSWDILQGYLKQIKEQFDGLQSCKKSTDARQDFEYAQATLALIKSRICKGDFVGVDRQIQDFLNVYYGHTTVPYVASNTPIEPYDMTGVDCGTSSTTVFDSRITTEMINQWNGGGGRVPDDIVFIVGGGLAGSAAYVNPSMVGFDVRLYIGRIKQSKIAYNGDPHFAKPTDSDTLTLVGMTFQEGDLVQIEFYKKQ